MDRNQRARDEMAARQEIQKMRQQFAQAVAKGEAHVLDRFAVPITEGSLVVWRPPHDMIWLVQTVSPVMDPRQPGGMLQVTMTATIPNMAVPANVPQMNLIHCGTQGAKPEESRLTEIGAQPGTPADSPDTEAGHDR